jgi:hypothetical protein
MKTILSTSRPLLVLAILLAFPAAWVIVTSILKFELGVNEPFDSSRPFLESLGINESFGWNINLLILLGPIGAFLLAIFQVLRVEWKFTKQHFHFSFTIHKGWFALLVAGFSISVLAALTLYLFAENCVFKS